MPKAIMFDPLAPDNFYYIIAEAKAMLADPTEVRAHMVSAEQHEFRFYIVATYDASTGFTTLESWYVEPFQRTWRYTTEANHLRFTEIERI